MKMATRVRCALPSLKEGVMAGLAQGLDEYLSADRRHAPDLRLLTGKVDAHRPDAIDGGERTLHSVFTALTHHAGDAQSIAHEL
jgi:hypothetical protein